MQRCPLFGRCPLLGVSVNRESTVYKYKKQLQKIEKKVGMEYQKAYKQG